MLNMRRASVVIRARLRSAVAVKDSSGFGDKCPYFLRVITDLDLRVIHDNRTLQTRRVLIDKIDKFI